MALFAPEYQQEMTPQDTENEALGAGQEHANNIMGGGSLGYASQTPDISALMQAYSPTTAAGSTGPVPATGLGVAPGLQTPSNVMKPVGAAPSVGQPATGSPAAGTVGAASPAISPLATGNGIAPISAPGAATSLGSPSTPTRPGVTPTTPNMPSQRTPLGASNGSTTGVGAAPNTGTYSTATPTTQTAAQQASGVQATSAPTLAPTTYAANAQLPTAAYTQQVTNALAPEFQQQDEALTEQLAGQGILNSGAGSKGLQDLTGEQSAAISSAVEPLLAQGNAEQSTTNLANAAASNSNAALGYSTSNNNYVTGQEMANTNQLANQATTSQDDIANLDAQSAEQLAQLGYSNNDYEQELQDAYGITTAGQTAANQVNVNGVGQGSTAYQTGQSLGAGNAAGIGAGTVGSPSYGTGTATNPYSYSATPVTGDFTDGYGTGSDTLQYDEGDLQGGF